MQLGLLLQDFGAPLDDESQERVGVYLTNSLTGWETMDPEKEKAFQAILTGFPELLEVRVASDEVKREKPILVILNQSQGGNYILQRWQRHGRCKHQCVGSGL